MAPHADVDMLASGVGQAADSQLPAKPPPMKASEGGVFVSLDADKAPTDYGYTFDNRHGDKLESLDPASAYEVSEHILWAPRKLRVGCIGAGASGIMLCFKKEKEFGDDIDLAVYDRYEACGGVWQANRYPAARCDVPSIAYQFSFAPSAEWSKWYSPSADIRTYYHDFAVNHGYIDKYIHLSHEVTSAIWQEAKGQWMLHITRTLPSGEKQTLTDEVDFLIGNIGVLNTWKWPDIPRRESFKGKIMHSAAYDESAVLDGKRIAVIGSGASSIQIVPEVAKVAKHLTVFYRTPQWITSGMSVEGYTDEEGRNFVFSDEQKRKFRDDPKHYLDFRKAIENKINSSFRFNIQDHLWQTMGREACEKHMKETLKGDERLIKHLVPDFPMGCRRLGPAEGFLECLQEPHVTLADSNIVSFTDRGILTDKGEEIEVDVIICATGFDVSFRPYFPIIGRNGTSLADHWKVDPEAYFAIAADGFPNFLLGSLGPNCPAGHGSFVTVLEAAQNYACKMIRKMQTENIKTIDVKASATKDFNIHTQEWLKRTVWTAGCRSWFNQGKAGGRLSAQYAGSLIHWRRMLENPRYEDFDITYRSLNRFQFLGNGFTRDEVEGKDLSWYLDPEFMKKPLFDH